jgi:putative transposase
VAEKGSLVSEQENVSADDSEDAARRLSEALSPAAIDALIADAESSGTPLDGVDGLLNRMTKAVLDRSLELEMADHLG